MGRGMKEERLKRGGVADGRRLTMLNHILRAASLEIGRPATTEELWAVAQRHPCMAPWIEAGPMRDMFQGILLECYSDPANCRDFFAGLRGLRRPDEAFGGIDAAAIAGTVFAGTRVPLDRWLAICVLRDATPPLVRSLRGFRGGMGTPRAAKYLGVSQSTAWHMLRTLSRVQDTTRREDPFLTLTTALRQPQHVRPQAAAEVAPRLQEIERFQRIEVG